MEILVHTSKKTMNRKDLEKRLIDFAVQIVNLVEEIPASRTGKHLGGQLLRSGTSPALNYAESQSAESRKDFIHKMSIALKELRKTLICLTIIKRTKLYSDNSKLQLVTDECDELVSIFVKSIQTSKRNRR